MSIIYIIKTCTYNILYIGDNNMINFMCVLNSCSVINKIFDIEAILVTLQSPDHYCHN